MLWWPCKPSGVCSLICTQRAFHAQDGHVKNTFLDSHVSHVLFGERRPHEVVYVCGHWNQWQSAIECIPPSVLFVLPLACDVNYLLRILSFDICRVSCYQYHTMCILLNFMLHWSIKLAQYKQSVSASSKISLIIQLKASSNQTPRLMAIYAPHSITNICWGVLAMEW